MTLAIYCAGGFGKELIALARSISRWDYIIFVDDITDFEWYEGAKVYRFEDIKDLPDDVEFIVANGEPLVRERIYNKIKTAGYKLSTIYGPGCSVLAGAQIGEGCVMYDCMISSDVVLKPNVFVNTKCVIGHDTVVGDHSIVSAACFIGGCTTVGKRAYLAPGSMIKDRIKIGDDVILSLGTVILRNVKSKSIMIGNPAKSIGVNSEGKVFGAFD